MGRSAEGQSTVSAEAAPAFVPLTNWAWVRTPGLCLCRNGRQKGESTLLDIFSVTEGFGAAAPGSKEEEKGQHPDIYWALCKGDLSF